LYAQLTRDLLAIAKFLVKFHPREVDQVHVTSMHTQRSFLVICLTLNDLEDIFEVIPKVSTVIVRDAMAPDSNVIFFFLITPLRTT